MSEHPPKAPAVEDALLVRAFAALRETTEDATDEGSTRARVLVATIAARRQRSRWGYAVMALAATFLAATAWAAATGRVARMFEALTGGAHEQGPPPSGPKAPAAQPTGAATATATTATATTATASTTATATATTAMATASPAAMATASPAAKPILPSDASDPEDALYSAAHRAHFVDKDPARALAAWDAYLAAFPRGRYALEARYNRGLDLARLGRNDEARAALEPFARGDFKGYRRAEARAVLDALGPPSP